MKTLAYALFISFACSSCVTTKETRPDGTTVETQGIDKDALATAQATALLLAERNSGK